MSFQKQIIKTDKGDVTSYYYEEGDDVDTYFASDKIEIPDTEKVTTVLTLNKLN